MNRYGLIALILSAGLSVTSAQTAGAPAEQTQGLSAKVIELEGNAFQAPNTAAPLEKDAWVPIKVGDELPAGTQIRTSLRTRVVLQFGDDTLVLIDRLTNASIDEFYKTADTKTTRLTLGYGKVRGGVAEGALRSDLTIDSPVATLSKRGTWDFGLEVRRGGYFRTSLMDRGLVETLVKLTGQRRLISPGQYVNSFTIGRTWVMQLARDRTVSLYNFQSMTGAEVQFASLNNTGLGVIDPAGGTQTASIAGRGKGIAPTGAPGEGAAASAVNQLLQSNVLLNRPEGAFGFGGSSIGQAMKRLVQQRAVQRTRAGSSIQPR
jgi:hypothetical protein